MARNSVDAVLEELSGKAVEHLGEIESLLRLLHGYLDIDDFSRITPAVLEELLLEAYPPTLALARGDDAPGVIPAVRELVAFLGDSGRIQPQTIKNLDRAVDKIEPRFLDAVNGWVERYNADLDIAPEAASSFADLRELLDLPDRLPPLRLPPEEELAAAARTSRLLARVKQLACWVGDHRSVEDGLLSVPDTIEAAKALNIAIPERKSRADALPGMPAPLAVRSIADLPELMHLWEMAAELEFVEFRTDVSMAAGPDALEWPDIADEDVLEIWQHGLADVLSRTLVLAADLDARSSLEFTGVGPLALFLLFLARDEGMPLRELNEMIQESATDGLLPAKKRKAWQSWVKAHGHPAEALCERLVELGAVTVDDGVVRLVPLAFYAMRLQFLDGGVEVPLLPPVEEMTAADLVEMGKAASEDELASESTAWLALRDPAAAVEELLEIAATGGAADRAFATSIAAKAGVTAETEARWRQALDKPALRPYAKITLTEFAGAEPGTVPGLEPLPADLAWLLTDMLAGMADVLDPREAAEQLRAAVPAGQEELIFDEMWRLDHPNVREVLRLIGGFHPDNKIAKAARKASFKVTR